MRQAASFAVAVAIAADLASGSPTPTTPLRSNAAVKAPCAKVSDAWAARVSGVAPTVSAQLAYDCLTSVPISKQNAVSWVDSIKPYLEWQSDPNYKANPPASYSFAGYNMFDNLATVRDNLVNNRYTTEYAFQSDLVSKVFFPGHDGHMALYPDLLSRATKFGRSHGLVSISEDGSSIPVIKFYDDVTANPDTAVAITKINGVAAADFIQTEATVGCGSQDADACFNQMFAQKAQGILGSKVGGHAAGGRSSFVFQGATTNYTLADGTVRSYDNIATIRGSFDGVVDGPSFYKKFCKPVDPVQDNTTPNAAVNGAIPGYPKPVLMTSDGIVSGYYLSGQGYDNVAVIALLAFESKSLNEFQDVVGKFLAQARQDGKTKLVIDFQANGGGYIYLGYDFFRQLFPTIVEDGYSRWKANNGFLSIAKSYSDYEETYPGQGAASTWFAYQADLKRTGGHFEDYDDKFGPYTQNSDPYTNLMRYDFNASSGGGFTVTGYGNRSTGFNQPFRAEDIVMLYDGYCASTCTLASEMLRVQAGVKSVAIGGRPNSSAMQGVGGIKGSQVLGLTNIYQYVQTGARIAQDKSGAAEFARYTKLAFQRASAAVLNVRDQILRGNVDDGTPAQYVYEAADCRLFWTKEMLTDITAVWKATADSAFNNKACVNGGITHSDRKQRSAEEYISKTDRVIRSDAPLLQGTYKPNVFNQEWYDMQLQKVY